MKILHILDHSIPLQSGYAIRSKNIFRCQQEVGLEPVVVTSPKHLASWKGSWEPEELIEGIRHYRTTVIDGRQPPFVGEWRLMRRLQRNILKVADKEKPDVLHAHSPVLNVIPALKVGRELGIPVVYEIRAFWEDAGTDYGTYNERSLKYWVVRDFETMACRKTSALVVICEGLRSDLLNRGIPPGKVTVVPNAVNPDQFCLSGPDPNFAKNWELDGALVVGFLGSFYHYEGLDLLLQAVSKLAPDFSNLKVLLAGGGPMEQSLRVQSRELKIGDRVILPGWLPHNQVPQAYALVDVLAYPRKLMRLTDLVTPLKPLEGMVMAKAQIASDVGGHRELIRDGETGLLFRAGEVQCLADGLARLLSNSDLRRSLGENGSKWVLRERRWSKNAEIYSELYENLLAKWRNKQGRQAA